MLDAGTQWETPPNISRSQSLCSLPTKKPLTTRPSPKKPGFGSGTATGTSTSSTSAGASRRPATAGQVRAKPTLEESAAPGINGISNRKEPATTFNVQGIKLPVRGDTNTLAPFSPAKKPLTRPQSAPVLRTPVIPSKYTLPCGLRRNSPQFWGTGPPRAGATRPNLDKRHDAPGEIFSSSQKNCGTQFKKMFERGDLPCVLKHQGAKLALSWKVPIESLDLDHYLPLFVDGIRERKFPCHFISFEGAMSILQQGSATNITNAIRKLIIPLKEALSTKEPGTVVRALRIIKELLIVAPLAGERLVPYYRQLLPVVAIFITKRRNLGDKMDYAQAKQDWRTLDSQIEDVLRLLEQKGGEDAFINIKYMIPTYESCCNGR